MKYQLQSKGPMKLNVEMNNEHMLVQGFGGKRKIPWDRLKGAGFIKTENRNFPNIDTGVAGAFQIVPPFVSASLSQMQNSRMMLIAVEKTLSGNRKPAILFVPKNEIGEAFLKDFRHRLHGMWINEEMAYRDMAKHLGINTNIFATVIGVIVILMIAAAIMFGWFAWMTVDIREVYQWIVGGFS
jgi:hypothetical protein